MKKKKQDYMSYVTVIIIVAIVAAVLMFANKSNLAGEASIIPKRSSPTLTVTTSSTTTSGLVQVGEVFLLPVKMDDIPMIISTNGEIFEYMSSDRVTKTEPRIKFKQWSTGQTLELSLTADGKASLFQWHQKFNIQLTNRYTDNSPIKVGFKEGAVAVSSPKQKKLHYDQQSTTGNGFFCDELLTLFEGERAGSAGYDLRLASVTADDRELSVQLEVNGLMSSIINLGESTIVNGFYVHPIKIIPQSDPDGLQTATFCLKFSEFY